MKCGALKQMWQALANLPCRFVLFKTQQAAAVAAQSVILAEDNHEFTVSTHGGKDLPLLLGMLDIGLISPQ